MLTFFTTAKAFQGHDGIIQRNALQSWKLLRPDVEVILFGDEQGAAEVCAELGLRHEPEVRRHESGTKYLDFMFARAREMARHEYLCFSNCDIVLMGDFWQAFEKAKAWRERFLLVARRWDTDIAEPIDFGREDWERELRNLTLRTGFLQDESWIDFFVFRKGMYTKMPGLIVGHCYWDNWMIWRALSDGVAVVDGAEWVVPVHQNHGYAAKYGRIKGVPTDALSLMNLKAIGGVEHIRRIGAATYRFVSPGMIRPSGYRYTYPVRRVLRRAREVWTYRVWLPVWHGFLQTTRPVRSALGLRSKAVRGRSGNPS
jgi:hypothetical protein